MNIKQTVIAARALVLATTTFAQQQKVINYIVVDGGKYKGEELKWAASHPNPITTPYLDKSNWYVVPRAPDSHYYVPGSINGHPVVFMVDTGATVTAIGSRIARNAGIRAGESGQTMTANGIGAYAKTEGNYLQVGAFTLSEVTVAVVLNQASADMVLLGMDVLKRFRIFQGKDSMQLQRIN